jgi:hypothetical protein
LSRNRSRSSISRRISRAIARSVSVRSSSSNQPIARFALMRVTSWMPRPPTRTASDSGRSRAPPQSGHGRIVMYSSIFSRMYSDSVSL